MITGFITFPNDTVRRRMQMQQVIKLEGANTKPLYTGMIDCYKKLFQKGGVPIFYQGVTANIIRSCPALAVQFGVFEMVKRHWPF